MSPSTIPQWAQDLNTVLGIIGFFLTIYVLYEVRQVRLSYLARARLPDLVKGAAAAGSRISSSMASWPGTRNEIVVQIKIAEAKIRRASALLPKARRSDLKKITEALGAASKKDAGDMLSQSDSCWHLYGEIQVAVALLEDYKAELNWGQA